MGKAVPALRQWSGFLTGKLDGWTMTDPAVRSDDSLLTDDDLFLFHEGSHFNLWEKLGSHARAVGGVAGTSFGVWAPNAERVSVVGDFDQWVPGVHPLRRRGDSGVWEGFVPGIGVGAHYKYHVESRYNAYRADKTDPFGFASELAPQNASIVADLTYDWSDQVWLAERKRRNALDAPISIYEVHLGSWRRVVEDNNRWLTYGEIGPPLADHILDLGFTHVEFLPLLEHPFYGSWGYQATGYFCPTSRYGSPQDLMALIDYLHQRGIGVILDWVPSHFPTDEHGLGYFDGTHLYEHADPRQGFHPEWTSYIFNYGRDEVRSFLISSALFWLNLYHVDGLRVDAVASMLYLNFSREDGQWVANQFGGSENIPAINFLRRLNEEVYRYCPDAQTVAEDSTAWPMVSRPTYAGGLGFGMKWDMGWMHDTLEYFANDPVHRSYHHGKLTFRSLYAFGENYVLPLSHDEVVHLKGSLLTRMPGDTWQKFANLRLLLGYQMAQPGKKLIFMGGEFGQWREWNHDESLDWHLLEYPSHQGIQRWLKDLNATYAREPALFELDVKSAGFEWVDAHDSQQSILAFLRKGLRVDNSVLVVFNFTPVPREGYRVGVPTGGFWRELLNSDGTDYGGSGVGNLGGVNAHPTVVHGRPYSLELTLPPLGVLFFRKESQ
jgi:1,4-alpha-glucan branching enzyme